MIYTVVARITQPAVYRRFARNHTQIANMNTNDIVKGLSAYTTYVTGHRQYSERRRLIMLLSCDVADALSKLKVAHGGFLAGLTMYV